MEDIDFSEYMEKRLSPEQIENSTNLVEDKELQKEALDLLRTCFNYYSNLQEFREEAQRSEDYYNGDQWGDVTTDPITGEYITEGDHIINQGKYPLKQNQIRQAIKNLIGQYRDSDSKSVVISRNRESAKAGEMFTNALHYALQANQTKELDVRQFEEFLISGYFGWKSYYGLHEERDIDDVLIDAVHRNRIGFNTGISDIRNKDIHTVFELIDVYIEDIISQFAENEADEEKIREWYGHKANRKNPDQLGRWQGDQGEDTIDFYATHDDRLRVYEIWEKKLERVVRVHDKAKGDYYETDMTLEEVEQMNLERIESALQAGVPPENIFELEIEAQEEYQNIWHFWFLTPNGNILKHGKTPYDHQNHPYTIGLFPLVGGKIYGLVHDIIDQQKYINRLITMMDFMIGASAKGVLLFPEDQKPEGWDMEDVAAEWAAYNGVIAYKPSAKHNHKPEQVVANSRNAGAMDMLQMQFSLLEKISGVTDAIQGHRPSAGTPSSLYAQQAQNASLSNKDFFEFFFSKKSLRDFKIVKLIQQFYDDHRYIAVGGKDYEEDRAYYDPALAKDVEFEMGMSSISSSTMYRQMIDEYLFRFLEGQMISFDEFLENTSMPFADKLKESREKIKMEMEQRQQNGEQPNPETMQMFNQMISQQ